MIKEAFTGKIYYMQVMDEEGNVDLSLMPKELDDKALLNMYMLMSKARSLDAKLLSLQRQGRALTYAPLVGEEATQIGSALALRKGDFVVPNFRQHAVYMTIGVPIEKFMEYWKGYEEGDVMPEGVNATPVIVPVSTQMPHAAGIAYAYKYKKKDGAVLTYVGDGGTSEGDFYEAINFAGVFKAPLVAIIENNQWAISVPRSRQSAAQTLAQKAIAAGINGLQVDGNDVIAVYKATREALENAKGGPTLIECITYRLSMHTTADDPEKYRDDSEVEKWKAKDPILRLRKYLEKKGLWDDAKEKEMNDRHSKEIDEGVAAAETFKPDPKAMFENIYSFMPQVLKDEEDEALAAGFWEGK